MKPDPTWGPFTGRQLTTIIVALLVTLIPGSVLAATAFSNVAIFDPSSERRAAVDENRRLKIGDGSGPVTVDGLVRARPVAPTNTFSWTGTATGGAIPAFRAGSGRVAVTDVVLSQVNSDNSRVNYGLTLRQDGGNGDCSTTGATIKSVLPYNFVQAMQTVSVNFATPVFASGSPVCLHLFTGSNAGLFFSWTVTGYTS